MIIAGFFTSQSNKGMKRFIRLNKTNYHGIIALVKFMFYYLVLYFFCFQTFLVRKCSSSQRKVLCLRVAADTSASSVKECFICEEDSSEYKTNWISVY